jgi:hypothetical protein
MEENGRLMRDKSHINARLLQSLNQLQIKTNNGTKIRGRRKVS